MKKLFLLLMALVLTVPLWAGEKTVVINRNEGQFEESNGVYYCTKGGIMMTFTSGLNNPNYLVEHQQVNFEVRSVNTEYIIRKIVFHCVDSTTNKNMDCFYWGPSTISIVQNFSNPSAPGNYRYTAYTGTWTGETTKIQFTTEAKPVRFGSIEITYDKEVGDVYDLVTSNSQLQAGQKYIIVSQTYNKGMSSFENSVYSTPGRTNVEFVDETKHKVIVNDSIKIMTLALSGNSYRPWYLEGGNNTRMRRESSTSGGYTWTKGYTLSFQTTKTDYSPLSIEIGDASTNYRALIRFIKNTTTTASDDTYAIGCNNSYNYFKTLDYTSNNSYAANQRVHLYMPAQNYEITTECDPEAGGYITLDEGVLEIDNRQTSQQFQKVTFFVGTNEGYGIGTVTATDSNGNPVELTCTSETALGNSYSFTMPGADVHIVATFVDPYEIHTVCEPEYGGEFTFNSGAIDLSTRVLSNEGKTVNFTVTASLGYVFTGLTGTNDTTGEELTLMPVANEDGTYTFIMPASDVTLRATFDRVIGDIFDLVTNINQIQEGSTYIIVSQYHDKVMKHWAKSEITFRGTPIVEWINEDKSKVRVDDNACFFRMDNFSDTTISGTYYKRAVLNTLVGYIGYTYNSSTGTGTVVSTPDQSNYNRTKMYIGNVYNYLCNFDSIGNGSRCIRYEASSNSFKIMNINTADERVWLYKLVETYHNISTVCIPPEGGSIAPSATSAQAGETVTFTITTNEGYSFTSVTVTYTDGTAGDIAFTEQDGTYSFTMPDGAVTITANFVEVVEGLYLMGMHNSDTFKMIGDAMDYDAAHQWYSKTVYYKGSGNVADQTGDSWGWFHFTTDPYTQEDVDNNNFQKNYAYLVSMYDNVEATSYLNDADSESNRQPIYRNEDTGWKNYAWKIQPGIYTIYVNKAKTQMWIKRHPQSLELTSSPTGVELDDVKYVHYGTTVTATSGLEVAIKAINENEPTNYRISQGNNDWQTGTTTAITKPGFTTVTGSAYVGWIEVQNNDTFAYTPLHYLEKERDDLTNHSRVVCDTLVGTWVADKIMWAKDIGNRSIEPAYIEGGQTDYGIEIAKTQTQDWDQSNWVMLDFTEYQNAHGLSDEALYYMMSDLVNRQFNPLAIKGYYYLDNSYCINVMEMPGIMAETMGYPGFMHDPREENTTLEYAYNHYTPANFWWNNQAPGEAAVLDDDEQGMKFFFVNAKVSEVAHVWAVWRGDNEFTVYQHDSENNRYDLVGAFEVGGWQYNRLDANGPTAYGQPTGVNELQVNEAYEFHIAVKSPMQGSALTGRAPSSARGKDVDPNTGAKRFEVYPLDLSSHNDNWTAVRETLDNVAGKTVESVRYFDIMGRENAAPVEGINLIVTRYTDGTTTTVKVVK